MITEYLCPLRARIYVDAEPFKCRQCRGGGEIVYRSPAYRSHFSSFGPTQHGFLQLASLHLNGKTRSGSTEATLIKMLQEPRLAVHLVWAGIIALGEFLNINIKFEEEGDASP